MESFLFYVLTIQIGFTFMFGAFWLLLRKEPYVKLNRFVLLGILGLSFCLPLLPDWPWVETPYPTLMEWYAPAPGGDGLTEALSLSSLSDEITPILIQQEGGTFDLSISVVSILGLIYLLGMLVMAVRFVLPLGRLFRFLSQQQFQSRQGIRYVFHSHVLPPFSFLHYLVANPSGMSPMQWKHVQAHELAHIRQWHSLDILLAEITCIFLWLNPLVWIMNRTLKLNLEFLADASVLAQGIDKKQYQYSLLQTSTRQAGYRLTHFFHSSPLIARITMMQAQANSPLSLFRYVCLLPLLLGLHLFMAPAQAHQPDQPLDKSELEAAPTTPLLKAGENLYLVLNASIEAEWMPSIQKLLTERGINMKIHNQSFNDGKLTAISVEISKGTTFRARLEHDWEQDPAGSLVFFYETEKSQRIGFVKGVPRQISKAGRTVVSGQLSGILIRRYPKSRGWQMSGSYNTHDPDGLD